MGKLGIGVGEAPPETQAAYLWEPCFDFLGPSLLGDWLGDLGKGKHRFRHLGISGLSRGKWLPQDPRTTQGTSANSRLS